MVLGPGMWKSILIWLLKYYIRLRLLHQSVICFYPYLPQQFGENITRSVIWRTDAIESKTYCSSEGSKTLEDKKIMGQEDMRFCTIWHSYICYSHCWGHLSTLWTLKILSGFPSSSPVLFLSSLFGGLSIHVNNPLNSRPFHVLHCLAFKDPSLNPTLVTLGFS